MERERRIFKFTLCIRIHGKLQKVKGLRNYIMWNVYVYIATLGKGFV